MEPARLRRCGRRPAFRATRGGPAATGLGLLLALSLLLAVSGARADNAGTKSLVNVPLDALETVPDTVRSSRRFGQHRRAAAPERTEPPLPAEATSRHSLALPGRTLTFTAKAGAMTFEDRQGGAAAEIGYFAYLIDNGEPHRRPVTFVINGGPGSASAWLHVGALGPWRLAITQAAAHPTAPADLRPNADTWLDFTDLVFIDPVGTGYTRLNRKDKALRKKFWSVEGDIRSIAVFVERWLKANGRLGSPKVFLGESYGGFRAPMLAQTLQSMPGLALNAIVLVSPALAPRGGDFPGPSHALTRAFSFPSLAATIADARGPVTPQQLAAFEREAIDGYLPDLLAGPRDKSAVERLAARVAAITGLDIDTVRRLGPRASPETFLRAIDRTSGRTHSSYDATEKRVAAYDGPRLVDGGDDLAALSIRLAGAVTRLARQTLGWRPQRDYHVRGRDVHWRWSGYETVTALRSALVRDPTFRVLVVHGYADLVTPYFRTKLTLDQMPTVGTDNARVSLKVYGGGHMLYSRDDVRAQLRQDALRLYEEVAGG